jgi:hypothetical protein
MGYTKRLDHFLTGVSLPFYFTKVIAIKIINHIFNENCIKLWLFTFAIMIMNVSKNDL